jgi:hypothetical protein
MVHHQWVLSDILIGATLHCRSVPAKRYLNEAKREFLNGLILDEFAEYELYRTEGQRRKWYRAQINFAEHI